MDISADVTLKLLKVALGNATSAGYDSTVVDWTNVMDFARHHGVLGVCFDALEKISHEYRPDKDNLIGWLGQVSFMENQFLKYESAIAHLSSFYSNYGLRPVILKGYGCSLNYPIPTHRPCGDIDIYVIDSEGKHEGVVFEQSNQLIREKLHLKVEEENEHHYVFSYEGFTVENHQTVLGVVEHPSNRYVNQVIESNVSLDIRTRNVNGVDLYFPSTTFYAIHLLRHMAGDFAGVKTTLRHVLDWATFVSNNKVDWEYVIDVCTTAKMHKFLYAINSICIEYLGYSSTMSFPVREIDGRLRNKVLDDILFNKDKTDAPFGPWSFWDKISYGLYKTKRMLRNRWKYNIIYDESLLESFMSKAINRWKH